MVALLVVSCAACTVLDDCLRVPVVLRGARVRVNAGVLEAALRQRTVVSINNQVTQCGVDGRTRARGATHKVAHMRSPDAQGAYKSAGGEWWPAHEPDACGSGGGAAHALRKRCEQRDSKQE